MEPSAHIPVLYKEVMRGLEIKPNGRYIDCTVGGGGHARGILEGSSPRGQLLGIDLDPQSLEVARRALSDYGERATLVEGDFRRLSEIAESHAFSSAKGVLLDLGVSSMHLEKRERGFSFQKDGPLDMRYSARQTTTAADLVNSLPQEELATLIHRYGEEPKARAIAKAIVQARPMKTTGELAGLVAGIVDKSPKLHPATKTFLALRIAVNDELGALEEALPQAVDILEPGGRLAAISFHSLEDRLVKQFLQRESRDCICPPQVPVCICGHRRQLKIITKKPVQPSEEEVRRNPRSRSAKLRIASRI